MAGQTPCRLDVGLAVPEEQVDSRRINGQLRDAGPAVLDGLLVAVLLRVDADQAGSQPQRQVFGDQHNGSALGREVAGHGEDPGVVRAVGQGPGQGRCLAVVELHAQRAALVVDRSGLAEAAEGHPQLLQGPQHPPRRPAQLRVVTLGFELGHSYDREHDLVLAEPTKRPRVGKQHRGVEDVGLATGPHAVSSEPSA